jgi:predicted nucleotidyltransferase
VRRLSLFGSVLREDFGPSSDVDVLVEFDPDHVPGFFGLTRLQGELEALVGERTVDLLTPGALSPHLLDEIIRTAQVQYAA